MKENIESINTERGFFSITSDYFLLLKSVWTSCHWISSNLSICFQQHHHGGHSNLWGGNTTSAIQCKMQHHHR